MWHLVGYLVLGILTFFFSFYFEGKELAEQEGALDPEMSGLGKKLLYCLIAWPIIILVYIGFRIIRLSKIIAGRLHRTGFNRNKK